MPCVCLARVIKTLKRSCHSHDDWLVILIKLLKFTELGRGFMLAWVQGSILSLILRAVRGMCKWGEGWGEWPGCLIVPQIKWQVLSPKVSW